MEESLRAEHNCPRAGENGLEIENVPEIENRPEIENVPDMENRPGTENFSAFCRECLQLKYVDPANYSPLALAYIGDAVYELAVRTRVMNRGSVQVEKMHKRSAGLVKAETQSNIIHLIQEQLTAEELAVYKRGRNAKSVSAAKNASIGDYRRATGFEALVGYLYLTGNYRRMMEIITMGLKAVGELE